MAQSNDTAVQALYGRPFFNNGPVFVHLVAMIIHADLEPVTAFGIYYGTGSNKNAVYKLREAQADNRAILCACLCFVSYLPATMSAVIYTSSQYLIHSVCHWAAGNADCERACAYGDVLRVLVCVFQKHLGMLEFWLVQTPSNTNTHSLAKQMTCQKMCLPTTPYFEMLNDVHVLCKCRSPLLVPSQTNLQVQNSKVFTELQCQMRVVSA